MIAIFSLLTSLVGLSFLAYAARSLRRDKLGRQRNAAVVRWLP